MTTIAHESRTQPFELEVDGLTLSGLLAEPDGPPRALLVALHGHGMSSGYFAGPADPDASLLELGAALGYTVWAPDRVGYGATTDADPARFAMYPQATLLLHAIERFADARSVGAGCVIVGHSFGLKLGLAMAGTLPFPTDVPLLGVEGAGTGLRYAFQFGESSPEKQPGDAGASWGPRSLYPSAVFDPEVNPRSPMAPAPPAEGKEWPGELRGFAGRIVVPVRFTFGEHERLWETTQEHYDELRSLFVASPRVEVRVQPGAGHNVSFSYAARAYHLRAIAFADDCLPIG